MANVQLDLTAVAAANSAPVAHPTRIRQLRAPLHVFRVQPINTQVITKQGLEV